MPAPEKPPLHGRDHRPIHFLGPDDPGGADPWCDWDVIAPKVGWGYGRFISVDTGDLGAISDDTLKPIDFTGKSIVTNDVSLDDTINTVSSPFAGEHFSVDWSDDEFHLNITTEGLYLIRRYFTAAAYSSAPASPFTVIVEKTGTGSSWQLANENIAQTTAILADGSLTSGNWTSRLTDLLFVTSTATAGLAGQQDAGAATTQAFAGISIVRLGSLTGAN